MKFFCGARNRSGNPCRRPRAPNHARCHLHAGRPRGTPEHPASRAARLEGRRRWVERMRLAKAQGLIEKFPNGRKQGVRVAVTDRVRSPNPPEARRQRMAERAIDMAVKELPASLGKPPEEASDAELFADNFRESLLFNREVLKRPINWDDEKLMDRKERIAATTQTAAIRVKIAELRPPASDTVVERLMQKVAAIRREGRVIDVAPGIDDVPGSGDGGSQSDP